MTDHITCLPWWREVRIRCLLWIHPMNKQCTHEGDNKQWDKQRFTFLLLNGALGRKRKAHQVCRAQKNIIYHYKAGWPMDLTNLLLFPYSLAKQRHVKTIFLLLSHLLVGSRSMYTSNKLHPTEQKKAVSFKSIFMTRKVSEKMLYTVYWHSMHTEPSYQP